MSGNFSRDDRDLEIKLIAFVPDNLKKMYFAREHDRSFCGRDGRMNIKAWSSERGYGSMYLYRV